LAARAQAGDRDAFGQLVSRYGVLVHGLCRGMAGSSWDAQDLAHDAFVEAWLKLASLRDPARFAPWLRTLTLNLCRMWHRQRRREREGLAEAEAEEAGEPPREGDALGQLSSGLSLLSADHRLALALHYRVALSYEEIAAFLEVPVGTVMSRLHRARGNLRKRMVEMSEPEEHGPPGSDPLRLAVDAEIEVLLQVWEEEARDDEVDSRYRSATCQRLSVLLERSPDLVRPVLAAMDDSLADHVAIRVRRIGLAAIEVAVASAFDADESVRRKAREVLRLTLVTAADQSNNTPYFNLPLRTAAVLAIDCVIRGPQTDADKVGLLAGLLDGCEDDTTVILLGGVLLCYPDESFELLWQQWWAEGWSVEATRSVRLAVLSRFGSRFLGAVVDELGSDDTMHVRQSLAGAEEMAKLIDLRVLTRVRSPDPVLETRTGGGLRDDEICPEVRLAMCQKLVDLIADDRQQIRDPAVSVLGSMGGPDHAAVLRPCLRHGALSTRLAAVMSLKNLGDLGSAPDLMRMAREEELSARRAALQALGQLGVSEARELVAELIDDPQVRPQAISALGEIGGDEAKKALEGLIKSKDKKVARLAASALYGGQRTPRPASDTTRERLRRVRGVDAQPLLHVSVTGAIRNLPEIRPYPEPELTRLIGEVCGDYSTTRRHLVMGPRGLMDRKDSVYELTETGRAVWRVERFIRDHYLGGANAAAR